MTKLDPRKLSIQFWRAALVVTSLLGLTKPLGAGDWNTQRVAAPLLRDPIWVYNNWSSYDELSDRIPLTEELAMRELRQIVA